MKPCLFLMLPTIFVSLFGVSVLHAQCHESEIKSAMASRGYTYSEYFHGSCQEGSMTYFDRRFYANTQYAIVGCVNEGGVDDLDLAVTDGYNIVSAEGDGHDTVLYFTATSTSVFRVGGLVHDANSSHNYYDVHFYVFYK